MWSGMADLDFFELSEEEEKNLLDMMDTEEPTNLMQQDASSLDDITLSQIAETMENEYTLFAGIEDLSISQTIENFIDEPLDVTFFMSIPNAPKPDEVSDSFGQDADNARFQKPVTDSELKTLIENQENLNTKSNTKWAFNVFEKWREQRVDDIPELHCMDSTSMNYWLQRFIVEARRKDGKEYPPRSLYLITCGLLRYLRNREVYDKNFLDENDTNFVQFRKVLDAQIKTLLSKGHGCTVKQADPITREDEEKLWDAKVFGRESAEQLQHTVFFYASKLFGLRGCGEHHELKCEQFEVNADSKGKYIHFIGRTTKTYKGGLGQMNISNKDIKHYCEPGKFFYLKKYERILCICIST